MDVLQRKDQLEIGCLQYYYLLEQHPEVKRFFTKEKIEETALRYLCNFWLNVFFSFFCLDTCSMLIRRIKRIYSGLHSQMHLHTNLNQFMNCYFQTTQVF